MKINIGGREIGEGEPVFIIAELSGNHGQNYDLAVRTIEAMKEVGADAVKLQTYRPDSLTLDCENEYFQLRTEGLWKGFTPYEIYQKAHTPWEWQPRLKVLAEDLGLICFSSPFDLEAVEFLEGMNVPAYKVASLEITDIPLIEAIASKGKPVIISTGIATLEEIEEAIGACCRVGNREVALLKCTSAYPAPLGEVNLQVIPELEQRFKVVAGLSDHTLGISVPIAAVALGARIIEKHFILDRNLDTADAGFSLEPDEFKAMVTAVREVEQALGAISYELTDRMKQGRVNRRSLFVVQDIEEGEQFTEENVRSIRPGYGLPPRMLPSILGKRAARAIRKGTPLRRELIV